MLRPRLVTNSNGRSTLPGVTRRAKRNNKNDTNNDSSSSSSSYNNDDKSNNKPYSVIFLVRIRKILPLIISSLIFMILIFYFGLPDDDDDIKSTSKIIIKGGGGGGRGRGAKALPSEFQGLIDRAFDNQKHCQNQNQYVDDNNFVLKDSNNHTIHLPQFGIIRAIQEYDPKMISPPYPYTCTLPPEQECNEQQFTVVFMAYNPDRIQKLYNQVLKMLTDKEFKPLVAEVLVVWNGERNVNETKLGTALLGLQGVRFSYPLQNGFPNDLMNRYHPSIGVKTKAIMYYDDDGPFYSAKATLGGFELWKRNSNAQIGAMARKLDLCNRQLDEKKGIIATNNNKQQQQQQQQSKIEDDKFFISHCSKDQINYNFFEFANFGANMVLPSGSFLHSNYLCFLWHPLFEEIRQYVKDHPVHPDDGTVSIIVSQLAGRAPKVYSRRINESTGGGGGGGGGGGQRRRRGGGGGGGRRRLMQGMDWDKPGMHETKMEWGKLRSDAANSLVRYFGSINSGSLGWCYNTPWQKGQYCKPEMAKVGYLPWLNKDHTPLATCP